MMDEEDVDVGPCAVIKAFCLLRSWKESAMTGVYGGSSSESTSDPDIAAARLTWSGALPPDVGIGGGCIQLWILVM